MCGIVGFIDKNYKEIVLQDMLSIQSYRGPNNSGIYFDKDSGVHFGHNRLSIQDLSLNANQPFVSKCKNYIIVFNGEVYNFKIIRAELETLGHKFISGSDTEVVLYSYKEWGVNCVHKFIGMFAFAILDKFKNELLLFRDRAGVKPLYYYDHNGLFMFSSEIKSFHKHPRFVKEQNYDTLPYFFCFGYIPAPHTIFQNCHKLLPGHYLEYDLHSCDIEIKSYWDIDDIYSREKIYTNETTILKELEELLCDAVRLRMISDVEVGLFLSGGYDSSLVAALLVKKNNYNIDTFTIGFNEQNYNEAKHAAVIAKYLGTKHSEYYLEKNDILNLVPNLSFYYDEPFGDSSALATMILSKVVKNEVSVAISSDGGDEAFLGYSKYSALNKINNYFTDNFKKNIFKFALNLLSPNLVGAINYKLSPRIKQTNIKDKFNKFKRAINSSSLEEMFFNASSYVDKSDVDRFLNFRLKDEYFNLWKNSRNLPLLEYMSCVDYKLLMGNDVLVKVDRATMSVGLEGREPLIDHRVIEYLARIPIDIKYKNNQKKYLLRQILYKYIPQNLVDKPKSGFQVPLKEWLKKDLKYIVDYYINEEKIDNKVFNVKEIISLKNRFFNGESLENLMWFLISYQMWKERWID